jgi:hypothetical protein
MPPGSHKLAISQAKPFPRKNLALSVTKTFEKYVMSL